MSVHDVDPDAVRALLAVEKYVHAGELDEGLLSLVKMRASQIDGCAWCLDMHVTEARTAGIDQRRLDLLATWHEAGSIFSTRERAALALTETVTLISVNGVPDEVWNDVSAVFEEKETVRLLMAIEAINVWNRRYMSQASPGPDRHRRSCLVAGSQPTLLHISSSTEIPSQPQTRALFGVIA